MRHSSDHSGAIAGDVRLATTGSSHRYLDTSMHRHVDPGRQRPVDHASTAGDTVSSSDLGTLGAASAQALRGESSSSTTNRTDGPQKRRPARVIAMANQKGGVGKTTTTINLGAALVELGERVLLIDMDPQGSLGVGLGIEPHSREATVYNLLMQDGTTLDEALVETGTEGLHLLPANIDLAAAELLLVQETAREQALSRVVQRLVHRYDRILIDCPPSLGLLTINGLTAADSVIVPLECEYFALRGMTLLMHTLERVRDRLNPDLELEGIVATMFDGRTLHAREVLARVKEAFGDAVFATQVNKTIRFAEAPVAGEPILTYASTSRGSTAYRELALEVKSREPSR
jgi:chromosome partitioning protein